MTKASDNAFPSILVTEGTEPSAPAAGKQRLYIDSTSHHLKRTDSSGTEVDIESAGAVTASCAKAYADGTQTLGAATFTAINLNQEEIDTDAYHDNATNNTRLTIPTGKGGKFLLIGFLYSAVNTTLIGRFYKNGTTILRGQSINQGNFGKGLLVSCGPISLADADYVELQGYLAAGGNVGDATNIEQQNWASLLRIGD